MADNKRIVLIGAGNVATHLGIALHQAGYELLQVYSRSEASASELAARISVGYTCSLEEIRCDADLYIISLKDDVLGELIPRIVKGREQALFVHTAGSIPMSVFEGHAVRYGVLYPMQTFSKRKELDFSSVSFFVEANSEEDCQCLEALAVSLTPNVIRANSKQRMALHISAVFACNFVNHMYALSARLLEKQGLPFEPMLPLIDETARKVHELCPKDAQTGPAVRNDEKVINKHLAMLEDEPVLHELYEKISKNILLTKEL